VYGDGSGCVMQYDRNGADVGGGTYVVIVNCGGCVAGVCVGVDIGGMFVDVAGVGDAIAVY